MIARLEAVRAQLTCRTDAAPDWLIAQCDYATLAAALRAAGVHVDALIVDAPYSARTHAGHDDGTASANRVAQWAEARGGKTSTGCSVAARSERSARLGGERREIDYAAWGAPEVSDFLGEFAPLSGWIFSLTDHVLAPIWAASAEALGRYTFSPIACVETGSRPRFTGDGPPQWSTWGCVSRPKTREFLAEWHAKRKRWGLAPQGAYVGTSIRLKHVAGGKPEWLMGQIVRDYTGPGDLVCDPCMGAGTTLLCAVESGRVAIGCEPDEGRYEMALRRLSVARRPLPQLEAPRQPKFAIVAELDDAKRLERLTRLKEQARVAKEAKRAKREAARAAEEAT